MKGHLNLGLAQPLDKLLDLPGTGWGMMQDYSQQYVSHSTNQTLNKNLYLPGEPKKVVASLASILNQY